MLQTCYFREMKSDMRSVMLLLDKTLLNGAHGLICSHSAICIGLVAICNKIFGRISDPSNLPVIITISLPTKAIIYNPIQCYTWPEKCQKKLYLSRLQKCNRQTDRATMTSVAIASMLVGAGKHTTRNKPVK